MVDNWIIQIIDKKDQMAFFCHFMDGVYGGSIFCLKTPKSVRGMSHKEATQIAKRIRAMSKHPKNQMPIKSVTVVSAEDVMATSVPMRPEDIREAAQALLDDDAVERAERHIQQDRALFEQTIGRQEDN